MIDSIQHLGKYQILAELGHGGFGTVFKALDTSLGREVALKVLDPLLARDLNFIQRFKQEARVTAGFIHPNIAVVFEAGEADGRQFITMQYVPGHNLRDVLRAEGPLPFDRIVSIVRQIGGALDYAHTHGAIHRDVKPSNIIVDADGHATLTDFGIAKTLEGTLVQTTSRAVMGTPYYASPEQAESKPLDGRSDLYSLGIVAYELCTQRVPFSADTTPSLLYKIVHEVPLPPSEANPRAAGPVEQVLLKAIARQPEQRYQTGREFANSLEAAVQHVRDASNAHPPAALSQQASATPLEGAMQPEECERQSQEVSPAPVSPTGTASRGRRARVVRWIAVLIGLAVTVSIVVVLVWGQPPPLRVLDARELAPPKDAKVGTTPMLIWPSCGTNSYRVRVIEQDMPIDRPARDLRVAVTSVIVTPPLRPGLRYHWIIDGLLADGDEVICHGESDFEVQP